MVHILKTLGYQDFRTLAQIESPECLEKYVQEYYDDEDIGQLQEEEKKAFFGPKYWKAPTKFKFLPGEKAAIKSLKEVCDNLLSKQPLVHPAPADLKSQPRTILKKATAGFSGLSKPFKSSSIPPPGAQGDGNQIETEKRREPMDVQGRTILEHLKNWCERKGDILYGPENYGLAGNQLSCKICHKRLSYTLGTDGYWKASSFLAHITKMHPLKPIGKIIFFQVDYFRL